MWFLWGLITFLVFMFSTVQLICVILVFTKYNSDYRKLQKRDQNSYKVSLAIHSIITIGWLVMAFTIPAIRSSWIAVLVCEILCVVFTFFYYPKLCVQVSAKIKAELSLSLERINDDDLNTALAALFESDEEDESNENVLSSEGSDEDENSDIFTDTEDNQLNTEANSDVEEEDIDTYRNPMFGFPMNEKVFTENQKQSPGFAMIPIDVIKHIKNQFENNQGQQNVKPNDFIVWWHMRIFGCYGVKQDLNGVEKELNEFFIQLKNDDKDSIRAQGDDMYFQYINFFGSTSVTLGTLYAIKHDYVKAIYYYLLGLRTEMVGVMTPYCDFIRYICNKVKKLDAVMVDYNGIGYDPETPCGSMEKQIKHVPSNAMLIIPELEGKNGEILFAHNSSMGEMYGYLQRLGSTTNSKGKKIDIYETMLIDKEFSLKKIQFYWYGYFANDRGGIVKIPDGFSIKQNSKLIDQKHNRFIDGYHFLNNK